MVMRQTSYTFDEAKIQLDNNDNNYIKVIKNGLGIIKPEKIEEKTTINQQIYKEIREFMDIGSQNYISTKNRYKKQQELQQQLEQQKLQKLQQLKAQNLEKLKLQKLQKNNLESLDESPESPESSEIIETNE